MLRTIGLVLMGTVVATTFGSAQDTPPPGVPVMGIQSFQKIYHPANTKCDAFERSLGLSPEAKKQRDEIGALLALAVVLKDWQGGADRGPVDLAGAANQTVEVRGHNIGGVLVDPNGKIVWWERNANRINCNGTQHGETRMMWSYLQKERTTDLSCYTLYTSLEPCAMCSGMMTLQQIRRTVYAQTDTGFGAAIERLRLSYVAGEDRNPDGSVRPARNFPGPFPKVPFSMVAPGEVTKELDAKFKKFQIDKRTLLAANERFKDVTLFLVSNEAFETYKKAQIRLELLLSKVEDGRVVNPQNRQFLKSAMEFLKNDVTDGYLSLDQHIANAKNAANVVPASQMLEQKGQLTALGQSVKNNLMCFETMSKTNKIAPVNQ